MKNLFLKSQKAMTLVELIAASAMVAIISIGALTADYAQRTSIRSASKLAAVSAAAGAEMMRLSRDATQAVGDAIDSGIFTYEVDPVYEICFRHDINSTPDNYGDDEWTCYYHEGNYELWRCDGIADPTPVTDCTIGGQHILELSDEYYAAKGGPFFSLVNNVDGELEYVDLDLASVMDNAQAVDPNKNPEYAIKASISPPGLGR